LPAGDRNTSLRKPSHSSLRLSQLLTQASTTSYGGAFLFIYVIIFCMNVLLHWKVLEYKHREKSTDWYWTVGLIGLCIAIAAFFFKNNLFGILILLSTGILLSSASRKPEVIICEISDRGVRAGKLFYPFENLETFNIDIDHSGNEEHQLLLKSKKLLSPLIIVPADSIDPDMIKQFLTKKLKVEEGLSEHEASKVMKHLGF